MEQLGKYRLVRRLAIGGMAEVFLAKAAGPMGFEKEMVVKRILPHLAEDERFVEMFLTEAKLAARLNHGNVVQIFDFGEQEDSYFIAMEYVEGLNLRTLSKRAFHQNTPISYPLVARIVTMICEGLAYAHELVDAQSGKPLEVIHRDISTDNIIVSMTGGVKVVDFGIAKAANVGQQTQSGVLKGKLAYMPPEYLMGQPIDARADIYAVGVVLYELIAGRRPFVAEAEAQLAYLIAHEPPVDVRTLRPNVPAQLVRVIERAICKDRSARYASCRQMQADLERFLFQCGEPVGALQIARLVKEFITVPDEPPPSRVASRETPAVEPKAAPPSTRQTTRSERPLPPADPPRPLLTSSHAVNPPSPRDGTITTTLPSLAVESSDEELMKLVKPRRWPLPLAAGLLILAGLGMVTFRETSPRSSQGAHSVLELQPPPSTEPPDAGTPATAKGVEPGTLSQHEPDPVNNDKPQAAPAAATEVQAALAPAPVAIASESTRLRVQSSIPAQVTLNGRRVGDTPWERRLEPGRYEIEVSGTFAGKRFVKSQTIQLQAGTPRQVSFTIQRVRVQVRGRPDDMKVLSLDGQPLDSEGRVEVYEGWHTLKLVHVPTGKPYQAKCHVKAGDKLCKFIVKLQ